MKPTREWGNFQQHLVDQRMEEIFVLSTIHRFTSKRRPHGQGIVEFALLLPILILIIVGVFDLGRAFHALITITNAAREGARYGTMHPDEDANMKLAAVNEAAGSGIIIGVDDVFINCPRDTNGACYRHGVLRVTVHYTFESLLNIIVPASIDMQRYIEMAVQ